MSILEEFINKYDGKYSSEPLTKVQTPVGQMASQVAKGKVNYKGSDILLWLNEEGIDPLRISFQLSHANAGELLIYPRSYWGKVFSLLYPNWKYNFSKKIHTQYQFSGDIKIIQSVRDNQNLLDLIDEANVCIVKKEHEKTILLTPAHGFSTIEQLENFSDILNQVAKSIENQRLS